MVTEGKHNDLISEVLQHRVWMNPDAEFGESSLAEGSHGIHSRIMGKANEH